MMSEPITEPPRPDFPGFKKFIIEYWGERCEEFEATCPQCLTWAAYDWITTEMTDGERLDALRNIIHAYRRNDAKELGKIIDEISPLTKEVNK